MKKIENIEENPKKEKFQQIILSVSSICSFGGLINMPSASFTSSKSYVRRSRRKGANRIALPSRTSSGKESRQKEKKIQISEIELIENEAREENKKREFDLCENFFSYYSNRKGFEFYDLFVR